MYSAYDGFPDKCCYGTTCSHCNKLYCSNCSDKCETRSTLCCPECSIRCFLKYKHSSCPECCNVLYKVPRYIHYNPDAWYPRSLFHDRGCRDVADKPSYCITCNKLICTLCTEQLQTTEKHRKCDCRLYYCKSCRIAGSDCADYDLCASTLYTLLKMIDSLFNEIVISK